MKIVFFGTPDYVVPILESLHRAFKGRARESSIVGVVTQKPSPVGRKKMLTYSAVDAWAHKKKVPVIYDFADLIQIKADVGVLAAYGSIIPKKVIDHFPHGILNVHPSLLPEFRGASPVQAIIVSGQEAGATIIKIDEKMDHGPIVSQFKEEVQVQDTADSLRERLFKKSAEVLTALLPAYLEGKIKPREQDHKKATFTTLLKKGHGLIPPNYLKAALEGKSLQVDWEVPFIKDFTIHHSPSAIHQFIRAMQPWPVAWTKVKLSSDQKIKRLKILKAYIEPSHATSYKLPATKLVLDEVQLEGKNPVSWKQLIQGYATVMFE